jgi:hypothetical protein
MPRFKYVDAVLGDRSQPLWCSHSPTIGLPDEQPRPSGSDDPPVEGSSTPPVTLVQAMIRHVVLSAWYRRDADVNHESGYHEGHEAHEGNPRAKRLMPSFIFIT